MKIARKRIFTYVCYCFLIFMLLFWIYKLPMYNDSKSFISSKMKKEEIIIAVVTCGSRVYETLNLLKSVLLFNTGEYPLKFVIITERSLMDHFSEKLDDWKQVLKDSFTFELVSLTFPERNRKEWLNLFKPCAAQRLFLPVSKEVEYFT